MVSAGPQPSAPGARPVAPAPVAPAPEDPTLDLELSAVIGTGERGIASISGRVYRLGQEAVAGWTRTKVDVRSRTATRTCADGRVRVLRSRRE